MESAQYMEKCVPLAGKVMVIVFWDAMLLFLHYLLFAFILLQKDQTIWSTFCIVTGSFGEKKIDQKHHLAKKNPSVFPRTIYQLQLLQRYCLNLDLKSYRIHHIHQIWSLRLFLFPQLKKLLVEKSNVSYEKILLKQLPILRT